jgi:hypothetical protein
MKLSQCKIGTLVVSPKSTTTESDRFGYIVGLTSRYSSRIKHVPEKDDIIPLVKFVETTSR